MDEWRAPRVPSGPAPDPDADLATIHRELERVRVVAVAFLLAALTHAAAGLQFVLFASRPSALVWLGGLGFAAFAVAHVAVGSRVYDGGHRATLAGIAVGFGGAVFAAAWWVVLVLQATVSLIAMLVAAGGLLCGLGSLAISPATARIAAARERLADG